MRKNDSRLKKIFSKNKTVIHQKAGNDSNNYSFVNSPVFIIQENQLPHVKEFMRNNHTYNEGSIVENSSYGFECGAIIPISVANNTKAAMASCWEKQRHVVIKFGEITDCFEAQKIYQRILRPNLDMLFLPSNI